MKSTVDTVRRPLRRSIVLVPAHRDDLLAKAATFAADVLLLDLQDSVPLDEAAKETARTNAAAVLREQRHQAREVSVRVNGTSYAWVLDDVRMAVSQGASAITLPEACGLRDVLFLEGLIDLYSQESGVTGPSILLEVETPGALCDLENIASASRRVSGLCVAPFDYAIHVEAQVPIFGRTGNPSDVHLSWLRPKVVAIARANGWTATDAVAVSDPKDPALVRQAIVQSRQLGFDGCAVLHPSHIDLVNEGFSPSEQELAWAHDMLATSASPMRQQLHLAKRLAAMHGAILENPGRSA